MAYLEAKQYSQSRLREGEPALKGKEPEIQENIGQAYKVQPGERGAADQAEK